MLKKLAIAFFVCIVVLNLVIAAFAFGRTRDRDLSAPNTAIEYQVAAIGGNYELMWDLADPELRSGLSREEFIEQARAEARAPANVLDWSALTETAGEIARVHTLVELTGGVRELHRIMLQMTDGEWRVSDYEPYDGPWPPNEPSLDG